jgi:single-strand DNA-binding protein
MSSDLNKVMLIGRLGADPELRYTTTGTPVANFNLATAESWSDKDNGKQERTEWSRIVVFGKRAETCNNYLRRGSRIYLEGRLQTRQWEDRDGNKRYTTEVVMSEFKFLDRKGDGGQQGGYQAQVEAWSNQANQTQAAQSKPADNHPDAPDYGIPEDEDYPF